jgi:hypothetical protein
MKYAVLLFLSFILVFLAFNTFASDYEYEVSGYGDSGYVQGEIEANKGEKEVEGYLYDESGNTIHFEGEWTGHGEIEGYDEDGNYIQLEVE